MAEKHAHPRGWIKGEPMMDPTTRPCAVTPVRVWNMKAALPEVTQLLSFANVAARDEWLKWWGGKGK